MKTKSILFSMLVFLGSILYAQEKGSKIPLIGSEAPAFTAETTNGSLNFPGDFGHKWKILFSHPNDFTPVCTSEIMQLTRMQDEFDALGIKIAVISVDSKERHQLWKKSIEEILSDQKQPLTIKFPLIADENAGISKLYGMLHEPISTSKDVRGVFIISPDNVVEATFFYPMAIGRNLNEIIRTVQALQTTTTSEYFTPVNWKPGDDLIVPHFPYTKEELAKNPQLANEYRNEGYYLWYKKVAHP